MRYSSIHQPASSLFRGPRGRTRAVLASVSRGAAELPLNIPVPVKKARPVPLVAPVTHYEITATSRLAG